MKILFLVLVVAMMVFMFGPATTDAKRLPFGELRRNLLNVADYNKHPKSSSSTVEAQTNEADKNESYGNYGHDKAGSSGESHHTFKCATVTCD